MANKKQKYAYGIKTIKFGTPTDAGTMPTGLNQWAETVEGSLTISEEEATLKDFKVEEKTAPIITLKTAEGALTAQWRAYDLTPSLLAIVKGGDATTSGSGSARVAIFKAPAVSESIELALQIETTNNIIFNIYKAAITSRFDGPVGRENLLEQEVRARAIDPGGTGDANPYEIQLPSPTDT